VKWRLGLALVVAWLLVGCGPATEEPVVADGSAVADGSVAVGDPVIDTWPVGPELVCTPDRQCPALIATARTGFDRRDPGHPAVIRVVLHREGTTVNAKGEHILVTRSGSCCVVARFELADGSVAAIGVGFPGVSTLPIAFDQGP
jgi:hypothetical protein